MSRLLRPVPLVALAALLALLALLAYGIAQNRTGVDVVDLTSDARFASEHKLAFRHLRDGDGSRLKAFEVVGYLETIVLDRKGRIVATSRGTVDDKLLTQRAEPLLKEPA